MIIRNVTEQIGNIFFPFWKCQHLRFRGKMLDYWSEMVDECGILVSHTALDESISKEWTEEVGYNATVEVDL